MTVGRDLTLRSRQNESWSESSNFNLAGSVDVATGAVGLDSFGLGGSSSERRWTDSMTQILARGGLQADIEGHTQLTGAALASKTGDLSFSTGTFGWQDLQDYDRSESWGVNISGIGLSWTPGSGPDKGLQGKSGIASFFTGDGDDSTGSAFLGEAGFNYTSTTKEGITRATLGEGDVTTRDTPTQQLASLNRDLATAQEITRDESTEIGVEAVFLDLSRLGQQLENIGNAANAMTTEAPAEFQNIEDPTKAKAYAEAFRLAVASGMSVDEATRHLQNPSVRRVLSKNNEHYKALAFYGSEDRIPAKVKHLIKAGFSLAFGESSLWDGPSVKLPGCASDSNCMIAVEDVQNAQLLMLAEGRRLVKQGETTLNYAKKHIDLLDGYECIFFSGDMEEITSLYKSDPVTFKKIASELKFNANALALMAQTYDPITPEEFLRRQGLDPREGAGPNHPAYKAHMAGLWEQLGNILQDLPGQQDYNWAYIIGRKDDATNPTSIKAAQARKKGEELILSLYEDQDYVQSAMEGRSKVYQNNRKSYYDMYNERLESSDEIEAARIAIPGADLTASAGGLAIAVTDGDVQGALWEGILLPLSAIPEFGPAAKKGARFAGRKVADGTSYALKAMGVAGRSIEAASKKAGAAIAAAGRHGKTLVKGAAESSTAFAARQRDAILNNLSNVSNGLLAGLRNGTENAGSWLTSKAKRDERKNRILINLTEGNNYSPSLGGKNSELIKIKTSNNTANKGIDVDDIPGVGSVPGKGGFSDWFNNLSADEFAVYWANPETKRKIQRLLREPGGFHEWAMVARTDKFKGWGFSAQDIWSFRTKNKNLTWINPKTGLPGRHGGHGSGAFHYELGQLIDNSKTVGEFQSGLVSLGHRWGIPNLPTLIRRQ